MKLFFVTALLAFSGLTAHAGLITLVGGGATTTFTQTGVTQGAGPFNVDGFVITGQPNAAYGDGGYFLNDNGTWNFPWVATNNGTGSLTIDLGGLYSSVGGFMNYAVIGTPVGNHPVIAAIAGDGTTVLESYDLWTGAPISTPGATNGGAFRGISRGTSDIRYFQISGGYIIMHDITLNGAAIGGVPEPSTFGLLGVGLAGLMYFRRRF
jgi:hypothetical protein